ncbi:MAG: hypothetical protein U0163_21070 [Gemmatimonadaceae bacterium]
MPTLPEFVQRRATAARVEGRYGRMLALFAVTAGLAQLLFLRWSAAHLPRQLQLSIAGSAFVVYLAVVVALLVRMQRLLRDLVPTCPQCGARLERISGRIAVATGRCDRCGAAVLRDVVQTL